MKEEIPVKIFEWLLRIVKSVETWSQAKVAMDFAKRTMSKNIVTEDQIFIINHNYWINVAKL